MINRVDLYRTVVTSPNVKQKAVDFLNEFFPEKVPQEAIDDIQYLMDAVREDALYDAKDQHEEELKDAVDVDYDDGYDQGYYEGHSQGFKDGIEEGEDRKQDEIEELEQRIRDLEGMLP